MARSIRAAGGRRSDKIHVAYGYGLFTGGLGAHYGAERLGAAVIPVSGGFTERQVQLITDFEPDIIMVTPSYMLAIADEFDRQKIDARTCSLRLGIFGAEPWTEGMRAEIERRMGIDAVDIYGLSEVMGPGVGQECIETKDGLTLWEDHFFPEIIDPETGEALPDGDDGELVLTTADQGGDAGHPLSHARPDAAVARHGAAMRRIERIHGRSDDMLIIRGVNVFPSQIEAVLATEERLAPHYVLEVRRRAARCARRAGRDAQHAESARACDARAACRASDQGLCRCDDDGPRGRAGNDRTLAGQGEAGDRPAAERMSASSAPPVRCRPAATEPAAVDAAVRSAEPLERLRSRRRVRAFHVFLGDRPTRLLAACRRSRSETPSRNSSGSFLTARGARASASWTRMRAALRRPDAQLSRFLRSRSSSTRRRSFSRA